MNNEERKNHWENIYKTKGHQEVSWYQNIPSISLEFFKEFAVPLDAKIIDIGGGDSFLVDHLFNLGYQNITVLDISEAAIEKAKLRLGERASMVHWIVADIANFQPSETYDFWHDRAAFHFLTNEDEINHYLTTAKGHIAKDGLFVLGTFSETGPIKCSGIEIKQYSKESMALKIGQYFNKIKCLAVDHLTPFNTVQNFVFCSFKNSI
jgi:2-polyprenyl-3-methyl-5-hydroxy-6-metoxy-1,4-benzoquinol methylase